MKWRETFHLISSFHQEFKTSSFLLPGIFRFDASVTFLFGSYERNCVEMWQRLSLSLKLNRVIGCPLGLSTNVIQFDVLAPSRKLNLTVLLFVIYVSVSSS